MMRLPRSFKPKGHPREGLAYLNAAEMEFLRKATDGTISRGPKGIPSFRLDDGDIKDIRSKSTGPGGGTDQRSSGERTSNAPSRGSESGYGSGRTSSSASHSHGSGTSSSWGGGGSSVGNSTVSRGNESGYGSGGSMGNSGAGPGRGSTDPRSSGDRTGSYGSGNYGSGTSSNWGGPGFSRDGDSNTMKGPASVGAGLSARPQGVSIGAGLSGIGGGVPVANVPTMGTIRNYGAGVVPVPRVPGDAEQLGRMMTAESGIIKNEDGSVNVEAMQAVGHVIRNRMEAQKKNLQGVLSAPKQFTPWSDGSFAKTKANPTATSIADAILSGQIPSNVGKAMNYGNLKTINEKPGYSSAKTKAGFNDMEPVKTYASALNPNMQHSFGTWGVPANEVKWGPGHGNTQVAAAPAPKVSPHFAALPAYSPGYEPQTYSPSVENVGYSPGIENANYTPGLSPKLSGTPSLAQDAVFSPMRYDEFSQQVPQVGSPQMAPQAPRGLAGLPAGPSPGLSATGIGSPLNPLHSPEIQPMQPSIDMLDMESPEAPGQEIPQGPRMNPPSGTYFRTTVPLTEAMYPGPELPEALNNRGWQKGDEPLVAAKEPSIWEQGGEFLKTNVVDPAQKKLAEHGGLKKMGADAAFYSDLLGLGPDRYAHAFDPGGRGLASMPSPNQQPQQQAQMDPRVKEAKVNELLAQLENETDINRRGQILALLAQLEPNILRYSVHMGA